MILYHLLILLLRLSAALCSSPSIQSLFQTAIVDQNDLNFDLEVIPPSVSPSIFTSCCHACLHIGCTHFRPFSNWTCQMSTRNASLATLNPKADREALIWARDIHFTTGLFIFWASLMSFNRLLLALQKRGTPQAEMATSSYLMCSKQWQSCLSGRTEVYP